MVDNRACKKRASNVSGFFRAQARQMMKRYSTSNLAVFFCSQHRRLSGDDSERLVLQRRSSLSELAGSRKTLEQIAKAMDRTSDGIGKGRYDPASRFKSKAAKS